MNKVIAYNNGALTYADKIVFVLPTTKNNIKFCIDSVIATDGHYLNPLADFIYEYVKYNTTNITGS